MKSRLQRPLARRRSLARPQQLAQVLDAREHRADGLEVGSGVPAHHLGERGLAGSRGPHRISDGSASASSAWRGGVPPTKASCWPSTSSWRARGGWGPRRRADPRPPGRARGHRAGRAHPHCRSGAARRHQRRDHAARDPHGHPDAELPRAWRDIAPGTPTEARSSTVNAAATGRRPRARGWLATTWARHAWPLPRSRAGLLVVRAAGYVPRSVARRSRDLPDAGGPAPVAARSDSR